MLHGKEEKPKSLFVVFLRLAPNGMPVLRGRHMVTFPTDRINSNKTKHTLILVSVRIS